MGGILTREGIRVLQIHMQDTNLWGYLLQQSGKCWTVSTVHPDNFIDYRDDTPVGRWTTLRAYRAMFRSRGAVVAVSQRVRDSIVEMFSLSERDARVINCIDNGIPLPECPAAADIFAIPSRWEGLPLVLVEAMAAGLPVVGSRTRGIADIVVDGESGLLSPVGDHAALGESVSRLARDPVLRRSLGEAGADLARRNYDIERTYERYLRI